MSFKANYKVDTTAKSFHLIERIGELGGAGVSELGDELDMSKSIVHNHLSTLREMGYVIKDGGKYHLSLRFLDIGQQRREDRRRFQYIERLLVDITTKFDTVAYVVERDVDSGVVTYVEDERVSNETPHTAGERLSLTESALGMTLLAELPGEERETILDRSDTESSDVAERLRQIAGHETVVWDDDREPTEALVTLGLCDGSTYGASIGVGIPATADRQTVGAIQGDLADLATEIEETQDGTDGERSFTTMKHHWFSE